MGKKILFVNSEIFPYLPETPISRIGRYLPQGIQERKKEIRSFMPRYGCINERKNQLHEVIRLSGMNIIINDVDRPLVIKVASISAARIQVYFIDNEDYFKRKELETLIDTSVNETLTRSLLTSLTTLVVMIPLYIMATIEMKQFLIPLMIGVIFGTYSSVFLCSPLYYEFNKKESISRYDEKRTKNEKKKKKINKPNDGIVK